MPETNKDSWGDAVRAHNPGGKGAALIVCEHASRRMPVAFAGLGLADELLKSHIAWDPGALPVAENLSRALDAPLVAGGLSRLLFDCNRPPEAADAIPARSEIHDVPGNSALSDAERAERVRRIHDPFRATLSAALDRFDAPPLIVTLHTFTPIYRGTPRTVEFGLLHDRDDRLAQAMLNSALHPDADIRLNEPYGPADGVTHTLREHALPRGALNVMIEVRNDLVATPVQQKSIGVLLTTWIADAARALGHDLSIGGRT